MTLVFSVADKIGIGYMIYLEEILYMIKIWLTLRICLVIKRYLYEDHFYS